MTAIGRGLDAVGYLWSQTVRPFLVNAELRDRVSAQASVSSGSGHVGNASDLLRAGCANGPVVGRETILNHPTTAVERSLIDSFRVTLWMAPDLGCFALRITSEELRPDGIFHIVTVKQALKVTLNP